MTLNKIGLGASIVTFALAIIAMLWATLVVQQMWVWFIEPTFRFPVPPFWMLFGVTTFIEYFTQPSAPIVQKPSYLDELRDHELINKIKTMGLYEEYEKASEKHEFDRQMDVLTKALKRIFGRPLQYLVVSWIVWMILAYLPQTSR